MRIYLKSAKTWTMGDGRKFEKAEKTV
jgi:hypothetical protein